MYPLLIFGIIAWAMNSNTKNKKNAPPHPVTPRRSTPSQQRHAAPNFSTRTIGYIDDGILSQEETVAAILMLKRFKELDAAAQKEMLSLMDARILAQFNHLMNSSWNMDDVELFEYLAQQGRQGRYTELGAFALSLRRNYM